ncbi:MAG TPA: TMEM175 family protein [Solirubrobacterales bacterium]
MEEPAAKRRQENEIEFGRIVAFSDGVFSIAITLLVLNLGIDKGLTEGQIDDSELLGEYGGTTTAVVFYSVNLAVVVLLGLLLHVDARRRDLTKIDDRTHRETQIRGIFLLSVPVAYVAPDVAPYLWLVLFVDPSSCLAQRGSAAQDEGDRPPGP